MLQVIAAGSALLVCVPWLIYPVVMAILAARHRVRPDDRAGDLPPVSVVVATRDAPESVSARVTDILSGRYPADRLEVVVAHDSQAGDATLAYDDHRVQVVMGDSPGGKASALNAAVRRARHDILVFTDAAQRFAPDAIRQLVAALDGAPYGVVSGRLVLPGKGHTVARWYWALEWRLRHWEAAVHSSIGVSGSIYAMHRRWWRPLPSGLILDDLYVPMNVVLDGGRVGFVRNAIAVETRRHDASQEFRRKLRTLTGVVQICSWVPGVLIPSRNPVWLQFFLHKVLRLASPYALAVLLVTMGVAVIRAGHATVVLMCGAGVLSLMAVPVIRRLALESLVLQGAVVAATLNGLRGRWDVWRR